MSMNQNIFPIVKIKVDKWKHKDIMVENKLKLWGTYYMIHSERLDGEGSEGAKET